MPMAIRDFQVWFLHDTILLHRVGRDDNQELEGLIRFHKKPGELIEEGEVFAEIYDLYGDVLEEIRMPVEGYTWAYPCGSVLGTSGGLQTVQTGADVAYVFTHPKD